jgi:hypothetical protein
MHSAPNALHRRPLQHGEFGWHGTFGGEHWDGWQTPLKHARPEQQLVVALQGAPASEQPVPPHTPLQHGTVEPAQDDPVGRHCGVPQTPPTHARPEQHSASVVHTLPPLPHCCAWQTPPTQNVEQQSEAVAHGAPFARHVGSSWKSAFT